MSPGKGSWEQTRRKAFGRIRGRVLGRARLYEVAENRAFVVKWEGQGFSRAARAAQETGL